MPDTETPKADNKVSQTIVAGGWVIRVIRDALGGEEGNRFLVLICFGGMLGCATFVCTRGLSAFDGFAGLLIRSDAERSERVQTSTAEEGRKLREWYSSEIEKVRLASAAEVGRRESAELAREERRTMAIDRERGEWRAVILKLSGGKILEECAIAPMPRLKGESLLVGSR